MAEHAQNLDTLAKFHRALGSEMRLVTIQALADADGEATLSDLAGSLVTRFDKESMAAKSVLYHSVLPWLDDVGAVEFDDETEHVTLTATGRRALDAHTDFAEVLRDAEGIDHENGGDSA